MDAEDAQSRLDHDHSQPLSLQSFRVLAQQLPRHKVTAALLICTPLLLFLIGTGTSTLSSPEQDIRFVQAAGVQKALANHTAGGSAGQQSSQSALQDAAGAGPDGVKAQDYRQDSTSHWTGKLSLLIFFLSYLLVVIEDRMGPHFRKSVPMLVAAGLIWMLASVAYGEQSQAVAAAARHNLLEFVEVFLFLLVAMTYISMMEELNVFQCLRCWLVDRQFTLHKTFWITGGLAFCISPLADNLTTALLMGAVVTSIGKDNEQFVVLACINIVVAANAGGAFSPFGDITTLMVWQKNKVASFEFIKLLTPSLVNWLLPAVIMARNVPKGVPQRVHGEVATLLPGSIGVVALFLATVTLTASFHSRFHLPPVLGMVTGLGALQVYGLVLQRRLTPALKHTDSSVKLAPDAGEAAAGAELAAPKLAAGAKLQRTLNVFKHLERAEWDTLLFFYGVIMCVGGLALLGYLDAISRVAYTDLGPTLTNIFVGFLSALVDNIPVMFAVLTTDPSMSANQWLLVTLTAGVGGSILSIGSAAGVGLMGQARGLYTFKEHLRWSWAVLLGYFSSIAWHIMINGA